MKRLGTVLVTRLGKLLDKLRGLWEGIGENVWLDRGLNCMVGKLLSVWLGILVKIESTGMDEGAMKTSFGVILGKLLLMVWLGVVELVSLVDPSARTNPEDFIEGKGVEFVTRREASLIELKESFVIVP